MTVFALIEFVTVVLFATISYTYPEKYCHVRDQSEIELDKLFYFSANSILVCFFFLSYIIYFFCFTILNFNYINRIFTMK